MSLPKVIGLCPDPAHTGEFYVPHGGTCPYNGTVQGADYMHDEQLVEYVPAASVLQIVEALGPFAEIANRLEEMPGDGLFSPLLAVREECEAAREALAAYTRTGPDGEREG